MALPQTTLLNDPEAVFTELSQFVYGKSEWVCSNSATVLSGVKSRYTPLNQVTMYSFVNAGDSIQKTYAVPIDLSSYPELSLWVESIKFLGAFLQIGLGSTNPNEHTHIIRITSANIWNQITWDISGIASSLKAVRYVTITATNAPCKVAFDELVVRIPGLIAPIYRDLKYLLDQKLSLPANNESNFPVPAVVDSPEFYQNQVSPVFLISLGSPIRDNENFGRTDVDQNKLELLKTTNFYSWRIGTERIPYLIPLTITIFAKYEALAVAMESFLIETIHSRGTLKVAGDIIDCYNLSAEAIPSPTSQQREFRKIFNYNLWTWLSPQYINIEPAVKKVIVRPVVDAPFGTTVPQLAKNNLPNNPSLRPDTYVREQKD